jgi:hypothetical protein
MMVTHSSPEASKDCIGDLIPELKLSKFVGFGNIVDDKWSCEVQILVRFGLGLIHVFVLDDEDGSVKFDERGKNLDQKRIRAALK